MASLLLIRHITLVGGDVSLKQPLVRKGGVVHQAEPTLVRHDNGMDNWLMLAVMLEEHLDMTFPEICDVYVYILFHRPRWKK